MTTILYRRNHIKEENGPLADVFAFGFSTKYHDHETGMIGYQRRFYSPVLGRWLNRDPIGEEGGEKYYDVEIDLYYFGYRFYSPPLMRWLNRDPIEEEGGLNLYGFCGNNTVVNYDRGGCAYFAYRPLDFGLGRWAGILFSGDQDANQKNHVFAHEQLIFEDGGSPINIGYFNAPIGDNNPRRDEFHFQTQYVPIEGKGAYNDCVMREAVKNVQPRPYKLWTRAGRSTGQYNCQDYADDLRTEYYKLLLDIKIRCKCNLK